MMLPQSSAITTRALAAVLVAVATLLPLPLHGAHARSFFQEWHLSAMPSTGEDVAADLNQYQNLLDEDGSFLHITENGGEEPAEGDGGGATVTSTLDLQDFFREDCLYTFHPLPGGGERLGQPTRRQQQQWRIQRVPKPGRKLSTAAASAEEGDAPVDGEEKGEERESVAFLAINAVLGLVCVIFAALAAGLTMGMLSLEPLDLEIKRRASDDPEERRRSEILLPLLVGHSRRHRLMCSLLLMNSIANEALPLFLDELFTTKLASIAVSVTLVLFFGEIAPSAFFTGPDQVKVAARLVPLVKVVMFVLTPLAVPIARILDYVLHDGSDEGGDGGEAETDVLEGEFYNREELSALVLIQYESQLKEKKKRKSQMKKTMLTRGSSRGGVGASILGARQGPPSHLNASIMGYSHNSIRNITKELTSSNRQKPAASLTNPMGQEQVKAMTRRMQLDRDSSTFFHQDEITMIQGALTMSTKVAADVYTPLRRVYALPSDTILNENTMVEIWARGFSRVPVYNPAPTDSSGFVDMSGIVGVLMVRQLIVVNHVESRPLATLPLATPSCVSPAMRLVDLINVFQAGGGRGGGGLHQALVCARPSLAKEALARGDCVPKEAGVVGIITLEDVVEELLQEEIYDECDRELGLERWATNKWKLFVKKKKARRIREETNGGKSVATTEQTPLLQE